MTSDLQNPSLLFELFVLVRVGVWELVDTNAMFTNLVQDLRTQHR